MPAVLLALHSYSIHIRWKLKNHYWHGITYVWYWTEYLCHGTISSHFTPESMWQLLSQLCHGRRWITQVLASIWKLFVFKPTVNMQRQEQRSTMQARIWPAAQFSLGSKLVLLTSVSILVTQMWSVMNNTAVEYQLQPWPSAVSRVSVTLRWTPQNLCVTSIRNLSCRISSWAAAPPPWCSSRSIFQQSLMLSSVTHLLEQND